MNTEHASDLKQEANATKKHHPFNVLLDTPTLNRLRILADRLQISQAAAIRQAIHHRFAMTVDGVATCANGQRCFVPQMHPDLSAPPHQPALPATGTQIP